MDPNATSILDLPASFTALQSAGSQLCLSGPGCCGAKPLHMLLHTSPSILPTPQNLHISPSAVLLSFCTMQMDADWLLLFNSGWICFYGWACGVEALWFLFCGAGRHWVLRGQLQRHTNRGVQALFSVGWSTCAKISWWSLLQISARFLNSFFTA